MSSTAFPASVQLPDEIVKEILSPTLHVPDERFADVNLKASPFATFDLSTSNILVVCKSWLRVATPLLYDTVVLRSKAQAQALAAALKKDSQLGGFIRKLRIEGGYGNAIFEILKRGPHITDLWISVALWSNENIGGYAKGLRLVNPCRLIVVSDNRSKLSTIRREVHEALADAIEQTWDSLTTVTLDVERGNPHCNHLLRQSLSRTRSAIRFFKLNGRWKVDAAWITVLRLPSIQSIHIVTRKSKPPFERLRDMYFSPGSLETLLHGDRALYDKILYESEVRVADRPVEPLPVGVDGGTLVSAPLDPNWTPLSRASRDQRDYLWATILKYAMSPLSPGTRCVPDRSFTWQHARSWLVQVCKEFNRIATPLLYEVVWLSTRKDVVRLTASPYKNHIKEIWVREAVFSRESIGSDPEALAALIESCSNLVVVSHARSSFLKDLDKEVGTISRSHLWDKKWPDCGITLKTLVTLSKHSAGTLRHLNMQISVDNDASNEDISLAFEALVGLSELRSLTVYSLSRFPEPRQTAFKFQPTALSKLEQLKIDLNTHFGVSVTELLAHIEMPHIEHVTFREGKDAGLLESSKAFFETHGHKLRSLDSTPAVGCILPQCQDLVKWEIGNQYGPLDFNFLQHGHGQVYGASLKTIELSAYEIWINRLPDTLLSVDLSPFKALETIHLLQGPDWPMTQREIEKSVWVKVAERFHEKWNIKMRDRKGKAWIPRLKPATASRSRAQK